MKPSSSSAILSQMDAQKAQAVTAELNGSNI
jgi:flagellar motility protein MotE (MotC chaperone)